MLETCGHCSSQRQYVRLLQLCASWQHSLMRTELQSMVVAVPRWRRQCAVSCWAGSCVVARSWMKTSLSLWQLSLMLDWCHKCSLHWQCEMHARHTSVDAMLFTRHRCCQTLNTCVCWQPLTTSCHYRHVLATCRLIAEKRSMPVRAAFYPADRRSCCAVSVPMSITLLCMPNLR